MDFFIPSYELLINSDQLNIVNFFFHQSTEEYPSYNRQNVYIIGFMRFLISMFSPSVIIQS